MFDFNKLFLSFKYAFSGVGYAFMHNQNLRIHFLAAITVVIAGFYFNVTDLEKWILGFTILLALCSEMINTSIEEMIDLITTEHRKEAKAAKDVGAGMVLVSSLGALVVGVIIFTPYILKTFGF